MQAEEEEQSWTWEQGRKQISERKTWLKGSPRHWLWGCSNEAAGHVLRGSRAEVGITENHVWPLFMAWFRYPELRTRASLIETWSCASQPSSITPSPLTDLWAPPNMGGFVSVTGVYLASKNIFNNAFFLIIVKYSEHKIHHLHHFQVYSSTCSTIITTIPSRTLFILQNWNSLPIKQLLPFLPSL